PDRLLTNVVEVVDPVDRPRVREALDRIVHGAGADRVTLEVFADEPDRVLLVTFRADGTGSERRVVGSIEDVTSAARLRSEARHDQLTGLLNRKGLEERLVEALADDPAGTLLVFFDLDGFKSI